LSSPQSKRRAFPLVWIADAQMPAAAPALVKGLIDPKTFSVVYGESTSGKTFLCVDLVWHIAHGMPWRGRKVQTALVVYIAAEAGASILRRFIALREREAAKPGPLAIMTRGPNLLNRSEVEVLLRQLKELATVAGMPVGLVVFDTLSRSIPGGDENSAEDMTALVAVADRLRDEIGAATLVIHHTGKDPSRGARGHSSLFSAADMVLSVSDKCATVEKARDAVAGEQFPFRLDVVQLGVDADGEPITTCVVQHAGTPPTKRRPDERLSGVAKVGLQALREVVDDLGEILPETSTIPRGVRGVTMDRWRRSSSFATAATATAMAQQSDRHSAVRGTRY